MVSHQPPLWGCARCGLTFTLYFKPGDTQFCSACGGVLREIPRVVGDTESPARATVLTPDQLREILLAVIPVTRAFIQEASASGRTPFNSIVAHVLAVLGLCKTFGFEWKEVMSLVDQVVGDKVSGAPPREPPPT